MTGVPALRASRGLGLRAPGLLGPELPLVALADWLFWNRAVGLSLPLFCAAVAVTAVRSRPDRRGAMRGAAALLLLAAALLPAVVRLTALSAAVAVAGTLAALHVGEGGFAGRPRRSTLAIAAAGPRRVARDLRRRRRSLVRRRGARGDRLPSWLAWMAPLGLLSAFTALLAAANPLIAGWVAGLPLPSWPSALANLPRMLFWLAVLLKLWPLVRVRRRKGRPAPPRAATPSDARGLDRVAAALLSPAAVLRALVLLDLVVALQLGLDGAFLWGGLTLPDGLTYAAYAHRGAYPLVAAAVLAGGVALCVRRPGAAAPSRLASALLALFLCENIALVACAMRRLGLYVAAYALTEWRVAAFAWMALVALGLGLIGIQAALGRDARWLVRANALAAVATLYAWCLLDVPRLVADYDVAHCAEAKGEGPSLDAAALAALGPDAIPALDRFLFEIRPDDRRDGLVTARARLAHEVRAGMADWRSWSLAGWRLAAYLDRSGVAEPATPPADDDP